MSCLAMKTGHVLLPLAIWVWVKIKPPGIGLQVLDHVSIYQGSPQEPCMCPHRQVAPHQLLHSARAAESASAPACVFNMFNPVLSERLCGQNRGLGGHMGMGQNYTTRGPVLVFGSIYLGSILGTYS